MAKSKKNSDSWLEDLASKDIRFENGQLEVLDESPLDKKRHWLRNRITLSAFAGLFLIVVVWVIASFYLPKIRLGNQLVSARQSDAVLRNLIEQSANAYKLKIVYPDKSQKDFTIKDMGLSVDSAATLKSARRWQHRFSSRLMWWQTTTAYLTLKTNDKQLNSFIANQASVTIQPAKDAILTINGGVVQITDSTTGQHYGLNEPVASLTSTVSKMQAAELPLQILSTRPAISSQQLAPYQTKLQKILTQDVSFMIDGREVHASNTDIADWVEITPNPSGGGIDITVNSGKVLGYINKIAAKSVHPPKAQIEVAHSDGSIGVLVKGVNGTDVINKSDAASEAAKNLLDGKGVKETLSVQYAAFKTVNAQAYDKWIEVDTTNKRMYAYEQTNLIQTFLISAGAPATPTVTGQYAIYAKYVQQDMSGQNVDGSSYFQPNVPWVNYFYGGYAIHGNYWRPLSWFGNINSSHGCVGVTPGDGEWIYSWAPIGTPVIIHT
jgi:lipoprotein-anchoring transpeptidase ErfK/SrfK